MSNFDIYREREHETKIWQSNQKPHYKRSLPATVWLAFSVYNATTNGIYEQRCGRRKCYTKGEIS